MKASITRISLPLIELEDWKSVRDVSFGNFNFLTPFYPTSPRFVFWDEIEIWHVVNVLNVWRKERSRQLSAWNQSLCLPLMKKKSITELCVLSWFSLLFCQWNPDYKYVAWRGVQLSLSPFPASSEYYWKFGKKLFNTKKREKLCRLHEFKSKY